MKFSINTVYQHISPYPIMIVLSIVGGITVQYYLNISRGIPKNKAGCLLLTEPIMSVIFGLMLTYYTSEKKVLGLSSIGGLIGMFAGIILVSLIDKKHGELEILLQNCTFVLPLMYSISKIGCVFAGCCHGFEYDGIFSIEYIRKEDTINVFPVQAVEVIAFAVIFIVGIKMYGIGKRNSVFTVFMLSASAKALLDFLRASHKSQVISLNQILCVALILVFVLIQCFMKYKHSFIKKAIR